MLFLIFAPMNLVLLDYSTHICILKQRSYWYKIFSICLLKYFGRESFNPFWILLGVHFYFFSLMLYKIIIWIYSSKQMNLLYHYSSKKERNYLLFSSGGLLVWHSSSSFLLYGSISSFSYSFITKLVFGSFRYRLSREMLTQFKAFSMNWWGFVANSLAASGLEEVLTSKRDFSENIFYNPERMLKSIFSLA